MIILIPFILLTINEIFVYSKIGQYHKERLNQIDDYKTNGFTGTLELVKIPDKYGYYHATNEGGYISWADFASAIFREAGMNTQVIPVTTEEYGLSKAVRPFNSRLEKKKLREAGFQPLPDWQDALKRYLSALNDLSQL